jgi:hypothetical protein
LDWAVRSAMCLLAYRDIYLQGRLNTLPLSTFVELIKSDKLGALEEEVFSAVVAFAKHQTETQVFFKKNIPYFSINCFS